MRLLMVRRPLLAPTSIILARRQVSRECRRHETLEPQPSVQRRAPPDPRDLEKAVGYPTPLLSLRHLLSGNLLRLSRHVRTLLQSRHPIVQTGRLLLDNGSLQTRGLTVLLISKLFNTLHTEGGAGNTDQFGITPEQRALAEIAEIVHSAYVIHLAIVNCSELGDSVTLTERDMDLGNKVSILTGDYLLARACTGLAQLHHNKVVGLVSDAIADMMEGDCLQRYLDTPQKHPSLSEYNDSEILQNLLEAKPQLKQLLVSNAQLRSFHSLLHNPRNMLQICSTFLTHGSLIARTSEAAAYIGGVPTPLLPMTSSLSHSIAMAALWNVPRIREQLDTTGDVWRYFKDGALEDLESLSFSEARTLLQTYLNYGDIAS